MSKQDELWAAYEQERSRDNREKLILHYMSLVRYVASRVGQGLPSSVEEDDLVSYGVFGLIDAIERFDTSLGYKFETFAISRIRGAMLDELRSMDWVPRSMRAKQRSIDRAQQELEGKLRRGATSPEMASMLDMEEDQYHKMVGQVSSSGLTSLNEQIQASESITVADTITEVEDDSDIYWEMQSDLADSIDSMPFRERIVVTLYYYEGLTLAEIGTVLGVTESRVCQIHTKAMEGLQDGIRLPTPDLS